MNKDFGAEHVWEIIVDFIKIILSIFNFNVKLFITIYYRRLKHMIKTDLFADEPEQVIQDLDNEDIDSEFELPEDVLVESNEENLDWD